MNLKIKEFNCEKAGFRAIQMENDANMLILAQHNEWHGRIIEASVTVVSSGIILNETLKRKSVKIY